jgi:hypothetical protein
MDITITDKFFFFIQKTTRDNITSYGDTYDDIYSEHIDFFKFFLKFLGLESSIFLTTHKKFSPYFRYYIKINDQRYIQILFLQWEQNEVYITFLKFDNKTKEECGDVFLIYLIHPFL